MNPKYSIYIVSKGRWDSRLTSKALERMNIPYRVVIEPQEYEAYASVIDPKKILKLPFSNLGQGSIPARNWIWEHSISEGAERHWVVDDNIRYFRRVVDGKRRYAGDGTIFRCMEDFVDRYENIALAGPQYTFFNVGFKKPVLFNTRIYSCILIKNDLSYRWRGRYNEDTDLSIRVLSDGWCTIIFYAFTQDKNVTLKMKGGNTDELYKDNGRLEMAKSLQKQHPDIVRIVKKWGRWQHLVDYSQFRLNRPILKSEIKLMDKENDYGFKLVPKIN